MDEAKRHWKGHLLVLLTILFAWVAFCIGAQSANAQVFQGNDAANTFNGTPDNDWFYGEGGSDVAYGNGGNDVGQMGPDDDWFWGGNGIDQAEGNGNHDVMAIETGNSGQQQLWGNNGSDELSCVQDPIAPGGPGNYDDKCDGGVGDDDYCQGDWNTRNDNHDSLVDCERKKWYYSYN